MCRERARAYGILKVKMHENRCIMGREIPGSGRGAHVIDVTREVDLRKEPLDFKDSFGTHMAIVEAAKSFVNSNGYLIGYVVRSIEKSSLLPWSRMLKKHTGYDVDLETGPIDPLGSARLNCLNDPAEDERDCPIHDLRLVRRDPPVHYRRFNRNCRQGSGRSIAHIFFGNKCECKGVGFYFCTPGLSGLQFLRS
jgi:hypothetical protein